MLTILLTILIAALVLALIYWLLGMFITGRPLQIIGVILAVILLIVILQKFGLTGNLGL